MSRHLILAALLASAAAQPAWAQRTQITPYIEATQVLAGGLGDGGDVLTYSTLGAGFDASIQTRRVQVQVSYQYERRFAYDDRLVDNDIHNGLARADVVVAPGVTIEGGAIATRTRADIRGDALNTVQGNVRNVSQVFSGYVGPSVATHIGPAFANAAYRFGYTKVEEPNGTGVAAGEAPLDLYDDSKVHVATASVGVKAGTALPIGVTASGSYTREDAGQLNQRFEGKYARGDVVVPVARSVAVTAGVGYEEIQISQQDALRTAAGEPVRDGAGRFVTDPGSPRRIAYDLDGVFWDAGVIWRPSRRTSLEARFGRRYNTDSYTGSFSYELAPGSGIQVGLYDTVQTFGQQLNGTVSRLPTSFNTSTDPFGNEFTGCIYGTTGAAAGGCLNDVFASAVTSAYRSRGISAVAVRNRGGKSIGLGGGYSRRTFLAPEDGGSALLDGSFDESFYAQLFGSSDIGANGLLSTSLLASYYNSSLGDDAVFGWGANAAYTHQFGRLGATASLGMFGFEQDGESSASAQALLGLRYGF